MKVLLYENNEESLVVALHTALQHTNTECRICCIDEYTPMVFDTESFKILTTAKQFEIALAYCCSIIGTSFKKKFLYALFSFHPDKAMILYTYLQLFQLKGCAADSMIQHEEIRKIGELFTAVGREVHRLTGFIRFEQLYDDTLYARCEPTHNIISFLVPHFKKRLAHYHWIIHDIKRNTAVIYDTKHWFRVSVYNPIKPAVHKRESIDKELWKLYFKNISIPERKNAELQQRLLPLRFRKHLPEF